MGLFTYFVMALKITIQRVDEATKLEARGIPPGATGSGAIEMTQELPINIIVKETQPFGQLTVPQLKSFLG